MSNPRRGRTCTRSGPSPDRTLLGLGLEISGFPGLVEGWLLGAVDAEVDEPACSGVGLDPLVVMPVGAVELAVLEPQRRPFPLPVGPDHPVWPPVREGLHPHLRAPGPGGPLQDRFIRASGANGCPLAMPSAASSP